MFEGLTLRFWAFMVHGIYGSRFMANGSSTSEATKSVTGLASPTIDVTRQSSSELGSALAAPIVQVSGFIEPSYLVVAIIGVLVFSIFNFRPKGKVKCFAGGCGKHRHCVYHSVRTAFGLRFACRRSVKAEG